MPTKAIWTDYQESLIRISCNSDTGFCHGPLGRQIAEAEYGNQASDGTAFSRPSTVPSRSDTVLVSSTEYNDNGEAFKTIDPAGKEDRTEFDDAGRRTKSIENYDDGNPGTGADDKDVTVEFTYNADGNLATIKAKNSHPRILPYSDSRAVAPPLFRHRNSAAALSQSYCHSGQ